MFTMTHDWLKANYGSEPHQVEQTKQWLLKYGTDVPEDQLDFWAQYKHLSEYQVNTPDIVPRVLGRVGFGFASELEAHMYINVLRVPGAGNSYLQALRVAKPKSILELGVGGDSAISTAIFLHYLSKIKGDKSMLSVDRNPLGKTWDRYKDCPFWDFILSDSLDVLSRQIEFFVIHGNSKRGFDMVFIDTIHSYTHTLQEMKLASQLTDYMLMDDATFTGNDFDPEPGGVKRAIEEWLQENTNWKRLDYNGASVSLLTKEK